MKHTIMIALCLVCMIFSLVSRNVASATYEKPLPESDEIMQTETECIQDAQNVLREEEKNEVTQFRNISFQIVDQSGNPIPNMSVVLIQQSTAENSWGEWSRTDLEGNTREFQNVPVDEMFISIENDAISINDTDRYLEMTLSAEEFAKLPAKNQIIWDRTSYQEAVEKAPVCIGFRVYDENGELVPMAHIELYAKTDSQPGEKVADEYYTSLGTYGYTEEDGVFLYAFPDSTVEGEKDAPYIYTATATYGDKKGEGSIKKITQRVNIVDIIIK